MADRPRRVLLVGHCGPDSYALRGAVGSLAPGAAITMVNTAGELTSAIAAGADLLLVNRVLDGRFDARDGVELIRSLAARRGADAPASPTMMLISNFADAQGRAVEAGAAPGFGKRDIYADSTRAMLRAALGL